MKKLTALLLLFAATLIPTTVSASHASPLYDAACAYRDAVVDFERHVIRSRNFDRYDVRLVDDLEDSTSVLRSAARSPHDFRRFSAAWEEVAVLHGRVEAVIFAPTCRPDPTLIRCWETVVCAYTDLIKEIHCLSNRGRYESARVIAAPTVVVPHATVPRYTHPRMPSLLSPPIRAPETIVPVPHTLPVPHVEPPAPIVVPEVRIPSPSVYVPEVTVPTVAVPSPRFRVEVRTLTPPHPLAVPRPGFSPSSYDVHRSRSRTVARPSVGISRDVHVERSRSYGPRYHDVDRHDVGAAVVGALLTRILN